MKEHIHIKCYEVSKAVDDHRTVWFPSQDESYYMNLIIVLLLLREIMINVYSLYVSKIIHFS